MTGVGSDSVPVAGSLGASGVSGDHPFPNRADFAQAPARRKRLDVQVDLHATYIGRTLPILIPLALARLSAAS